MFTKKNKKVDSSELNGSEMRELSGRELSSVNGAGGFVWVEGRKSGRRKGLSAGVGYEWRF